LVPEDVETAMSVTLVGAIVVESLRASVANPAQVDDPHASASPVGNVAVSVQRL